MDIKTLFGVAAVLLTFAVDAVYIALILRGRTKPHLYTHLVWAIVVSIIFLGQYTTGAGSGSWASGTSVILTIGIVALSVRFGTKDITTIDRIALALAFASIIPWLFLSDPFWSIVFAVLTDILAIFPTFRKTWNDPYSEPILSWGIAEVKMACAFLALSTYSFTTWAYPVEAFIMNAILIAIIIHRRSILNHVDAHPASDTRQNPEK